MSKKSITYKLIITFTAITGSVLILIGMILSFWFNKDYVAERINILERQLSLIEQANTSYLNQNSETSYEELLNSMAMVEFATNMKSIIVDNQGYIYAVSNKEFDRYKYSKVDLSEENFKTIINGESERIRFYHDGVELEGYSKSIYYNDNLSGAILMIGNEKYIEAPSRIYVTIWLSVILALVLSSFIMYYFAKKILIKPLEEINNAAKRLSRGDARERVSIKSDDEIGELAESFNIMASSLEEVDIKRRDFISNVSHELRSPITSIKGFISGILDGVIPKDRENYYLNVVNDEVSRLARLVNELLDISSMESGKFKLNKVRLDINQIITLCILNLESKIKSKMMNVEIVFHDKYEYAIGDRDRLIQVVTNLIENSIKYGNEKGQIKIDTYTKGDKVYVSVFNSGSNLSKEELSNIWDRFYKSDKSRTNKISTGLGLSIVRLIITQHGQDVWVNNIENKGVNFIFTLEKG
ncbi:MAG: HAMP domain-containing sensor histidine kinase [Terrisporobacter sp.]|uniref:sensor histidine kinase n=1 Tax=Clostridia TaxID=186801 RepID=UPI002FC8D7EE